MPDVEEANRQENYSKNEVALYLILPLQITMTLIPLIYKKIGAAILCQG